jgi:hypothetical protein
MDKLENFVRGVAGSASLLTKAIENNAFIECVSLLSNQIDALLRIGLILDAQLKEDNTLVIDELLYQGVSDKTITEKEIYIRSLSNNIIKRELKDELDKLYTERNKVIHRYIISDLKTSEIQNTAIKYARIKETIQGIIVELENEQIRTHRGMIRQKPYIEDYDLNSVIANMEKLKHS